MIPHAETHTVASHYYSPFLLLRPSFSSPSSIFSFFLPLFLLLLLPSSPSSFSFFHLLLQEDKSEEAAMNEEGHGAEDKDADDKHAADSASTELAEMAAVQAVTRSTAVQVRLLYI